MRKYRRLTSEERHTLSTLRKQGYFQRALARALGRDPSTINREVRRNSRRDGAYRPGVADVSARARRSRSRRNTQFGWDAWALVITFLEEDWSPEQIAGRLNSNTRMSVRESPEPSHVHLNSPTPVPPLSQKAASGGQRSLDVGSWAHAQRSCRIRGVTMLRPVRWQCRWSF